MEVRRGMLMEDVLAVRDDFQLVESEDGYEEYEGESFDGYILCVSVQDGVIEDVCLGCYV